MLRVSLCCVRLMMFREHRIRLRFRYPMNPCWRITRESTTRDWVRSSRVIIRRRSRPLSSYSKPTRDRALSYRSYRQRGVRLCFVPRHGVSSFQQYTTNASKLASIIIRERYTRRTSRCYIKNKNKNT